MNYVFFDIECASVHKTTAKICAFGYVLCDDKFNIIEKRDILINPKGRFELTDRRGEHGLVLPYEYDEFRKYPPFPRVYPQIRKLLEDKNNCVFGHATLNDVKYLDLETYRFHLPPFDFDFSDSQLMYMTAIGDYSRQFGLEYITKDLNVEFTPHRAADDAYATMRIVEALCRKYGCGCRELEDKLQIRRGRIRAHRVIKPASRGFSDYKKEQIRKRKERGENRTKFFIALSRKRVRKDGGELKGRVFNFSRAVEDEAAVSIGYLDRIYELGGRYTQKLAECNIYVRGEDDKTVRTANAEKVSGLCIIDESALRELLHV